MNTGTSPDSVAAPKEKPSAAPKSTPVEAPAAAAPAPVPNVQIDPFAAAAAEAFGTIEAAPKPRVLEESFSAPAAEAVPAAPVAEPAAQEFVAPAWQQPAEAFSAPAWDAPTEPSSPVAQPEAVFSAPAWEAPVASQPFVAEPVVTESMGSEPVVTEPVAAPFYVAPGWEDSTETQATPEVVAPAVSEAPVADVQPREEAFTAPEVFVAAPEVAFDMPQAVSVAQPEPVAEQDPAQDAEAPQGPTNFTFEPSRPDGSRIKRRVREKRARDFSAMGASDDAKASRPQAVTDAFAPNVPVDTRPIDQVDDALIASGVMAPRAGDSLTSNLPGGVAESTMRFEPEPLPVAPVLPETPAAPAPLPAERAAPVQASVPEPVSIPEPVAQPAPQPLPEPLPQPAAAAQPLPMPTLPEADIRVPSFNLSNAPLPQAEAPLPAPQSDLPWVQSQTAAEWDIGTTGSHDWAQSQPETASEPAMHMPPQADLYKSMPGRSSSVPPQLPGGIPSPSASGHMTPELPGQRRRAQGTPWALVAVGAVVVVAAGAYLLTSGKQGAGAQLANLTNRTATGNEQQPLLPPPDGSGTGSSSFMAAQPLPSPSPATDPSSSAMVAFADVPAEVANQPIVADGNEEMPKGFIAQFQSEVEKARTLKESGVAPAEEVGSLTSATTPPAGTGYTQDDLKKELEAYRTALASSANPAELKPGNFEASQAGSKTDAEMGSGSLLPPPAALPPAELYTNNPKGLPVVAEPVTNAPERVRTLADFPEVEAYMPEREKVEIPANLKPKLAATDFPALEVLSYVPNQGVVAFADGREGVLLIGESINGWELVAVNADTAEFKAGQKSYQVTSQN